MKNQYFGDNRDLFKFDLVYQMVEEGLVERFTYISMLTPNVTETFEYNACRTGAAGGTENRDLVDFLDRAAAGDKREISELEEFFRNKNITARIYSKDRFFTQADRRSYFGGIGQDLLTKSLILIDPDRGLEEDVNGDGNLLYSELAGIYEKTGKRHDHFTGYGGDHTLQGHQDEDAGVAQIGDELSDVLQ